MNRKFAVVLAMVAIAVTSAVAGMKNPVVGGKEMYPTKNIIENAVNSADHTTLVAAVGGGACPLQRIDQPRRLYRGDQGGVICRIDRVFDNVLRGIHLLAAHYWIVHSRQSRHSCQPHHC